MKIAICGMHPRSKPSAPWDDAAWQKWVCPGDRDPRADAIIVPYAAGRVEPYWLRPGLQVFTQYPRPDIPGSTLMDRAAIEEVASGFLENSICFALAHAITLNPEEIGVYGCEYEFSPEERLHERPATAHLIGFARGRGIPVTIPPESRLFASAWPRGFYG